MAMLAERKHKQRLSLNPRGNEWSDDSNKFGQKLMEKMGWKRGKGLGAKLDGTTEHIRVSHKRDSKGMGYKETEQWTQHDENFTKLLNGLAENSGVGNIDFLPKSLEEMSANSKKRVHYHKFTRGKDLSQYSEKQLANIFGKKGLEPKNDEINIQYGVETLGGGSMVDYFKNKLGGRFVSNNGDFEIGNNGVLRKVKGEKYNSDCDLHRPCFDFQENGEFIEATNVQNDFNKQKSSKKRKLIKNVDEEVYENAIFDGSLNESRDDCRENVLENPYEVKPKKKKIKMDVSNERNDEKLRKKTKTDISEVISPVEKIVKTKKKKNNKITPINDEEIIKKKKSKKNRQNEEISSSSSGNTADLLNNSELKNLETPLKKSKLNKSICDTTIEQQTTTEENSAKKKMKKPKKTGLENPNFDENESGNNSSCLVDVNSEFEVKRKCRKKEKSSGLDNPGLNVSNLFDGSYEEGLSISAQENLYCGFENLALNISKSDSIGACASDIIQCDIMLNVAGLPNSAQIEGRKSVRFSGINQQYIIPNNFDNKLMEQKLEGLANAAFDERAATMEENMMAVEQHLSTDCARVENDLNEVRAAAHARLSVPIAPINSGASICHGNAGIRSLPSACGNRGAGRIMRRESAEDFPEIGEEDCLEANQTIANGDVRLSYKLASFKVTNVPPYLRKQPKNTDRAAYKHLVKGDIILAFKKTNLHGICGYGNN